MNKYKIKATIHDYNNPGQKESQRVITEINKVYNYPEYESFAKSKIYDNGLTRGVKINIYCEDLNCVRDQITFLTLNITQIFEERSIKKKFKFPSVQIILKLIKEEL